MSVIDSRRSRLAERLADFSSVPQYAVPVREVHQGDGTAQAHVEPHVLQSRIAQALQQGPVCLPIGSTVGVTDFAALKLAGDVEAEFDCFVVEAGLDGRALDQCLQDILPNSSNPAAPLIALGSAAGARVDAVVADCTPQAVSAAMARLHPITSRLAGLPAIERGPSRNRLLALTLAYTRGVGVEASWAPDSRSVIGYPLLAGIQDARGILEDLADRGLVTRKFFDKAHVCSHCSSSRLVVREVCPKCRSSDIEDRSLVHHYPCGHQASEDAFRAAGGGYHCPKCSTQLRHYGLDYDKPGTVSVCRHCSHHSNEPDVSFVCADCHRSEPADQAKLETWYHYEVTADGVAAVKTGVLSTDDRGRASDGRSTLRDFRMLSQHMLALSVMHARPIASLRITIDHSALQAGTGNQRATEVLRFVQEIALQAFCDSDVVAVTRDGLVACMPETSQAEANEIAKHISQAVSGNVKDPVSLSFDVRNRVEDIVALVKGVR